MLIKTGKTFKNGRSQAVRLPKEFRFNCHEVNITKDGNKVIIWPKAKSWDPLVNTINELPSSFSFQRIKDKF